MDKRLRNIKAIYEKEIPTSFTIEDKKQVFKRIVEEENKPQKAKVTIIPKTISFVVYAALILIIAGITNHQLNIISFTSESGGTDGEVAIVEQEEEEPIVDQEGENSTEELVTSDKINSTIELDDHLLSIYESYVIDHDDLLLKGLDPLDVFKLYFHALHKEDMKTKYALFIKGETYFTPSEEEFFANPEMYGAKPTESDKAMYKELQKSDRFDLEYIDEGEAIITWEAVKEQGLAFRLIKDTTADVWKVSYLPMQ